MSTKGAENCTIGARLREERDRFDLTQEQLGAYLQTSGRTIKKYEANETSIRATELFLFSSLGADVLYIVTGNRLPVDLEHPSTPALRLAAAIAVLNLSDADAEFVSAMARRLASQ